MRLREHAHIIGVWLRVIGVLALVIAAGFAGLWLGGRSVHLNDDGQTKAAVPTGSETSVTRQPPPLFLSVSVASGAGGSVAADEIAMAAAAGIHQYIIPVALPWQGEVAPLLEPIATVLQRDPVASIYLSLKLDPPSAWLGAHPDDTMKVAGKDTSYACVASDAWRADARVALEALMGGVAALPKAAAVTGYVLGGLDSGRWIHPEGYDTSAANLAGFRKWLKTEHPGDDTVDGATIPDKPPTGGCEAFFEVPTAQRQVDFLAYTSAGTADAIRELVACVKQKTLGGTKVFAMYGYALELTSGDAGHFALSRLLDSEIDGFVSPISYVDRGLGGAGGVMGAVDSARLHGKQWLLVDDTRTGIARDPATGRAARPKNLRADDVYSVQERNFACALTHGLGVAWADPEGDGWLCDEEMWKRFAKMSGVYSEVTGWQLAQDAFPSSPLLAVVVDEASRFYQQCDKSLNEMVLNNLRDSAVRAGLPTRFYLLRDVIDGRVPAAAYLFLNAFRLSAEDRGKLRTVLQQNRAAAIWMYAPGLIDDKADVNNISETTGVKTKAFPASAQTGSVYLLSGKWVGKDEEFGVTQELQPLFYIDDPDTDVVAKYRVSGKPSIAVRFFTEGWASIFCADPSVTAPVLKELLSILEQRLLFTPGSMKFADAVSFGPGIIGIHAKENGDRQVNLGKVCDVQDMLAPDIGWLRKHSFAIPLKAGETRLLKLTPVADETPAPAPPAGASPPVS